MQTSKEYRHNAEICLKLASETKEIYAKVALVDLATEFRALRKIWNASRGPLNTKGVTGFGRNHLSSIMVARRPVTHHQNGALARFAGHGREFGHDIATCLMIYQIGNRVQDRAVEKQTGRPMITVPALTAEALGSFLASDMNRRFGSSHARLTELVPSVAGLALECIGNSDALYHNVEHTMLVTLAAHDIMKGRALLVPTLPIDYAHVIVAGLMHDIGYVRGILKGDGPDGYVIDATGRKAKLPRGSSDAAESRPQESEQDDKWSFCLTAGTLCPANQEKQ